MPLVDMPLAELEKYQGRNPKPADFDAYWDKALAEMDATDMQLEFTPAAWQVPGAKCYDLYFTGVKGARVYAKYLTPTASGKYPAVLHFHGYTGSTGDWSNYLGYVNAGIAVLALDCRGQGGKSGDVGGVQGNTHNGHIIRGLQDPDNTNLLYRQIFLDTAMLAKTASQLDGIDAQRLGAAGGSQGGGLTLACAALSPLVKFVAPTYPFLCDYQRVYEMDLDKDAYAELKTFFRFFDPLHEKEVEYFTKLGYIDVQHLAPRIKAHVMMAVGMIDTVCPPSTQYAAYNKITSKKETVIYPNYGHEGLPGWQDRVLKYFADALL